MNDRGNSARAKSPKALIAALVSFRHLIHTAGCWTSIGIAKSHKIARVLAVTGCQGVPQFSNWLTLTETVPSRRYSNYCQKRDDSVGE